MNVQIELRKIIDWINSQEPIISIILWIAVLIFVIIPFGLPVAIGYFLWTLYKGREHAN